MAALKIESRHQLSALVVDDNKENMRDMSPPSSSDRSGSADDNNNEKIVHPPSKAAVPKSIEEIDRLHTIGTGTFGRVMLVKKKKTEDYYALKIMSIRCVINTKQVDHVHSEKRILMKLTHPFIVTLHWTSVDEKCLYLLFDFVPGGELFSYLRASGRFGNRMSRFYAAEIVSALDYMHSRNVVYRDLKPENLMLDSEGHLKITDFGFAKELLDRTWTLCGTPEYLAPEVIANKGHNKAVDWWALGVLIYEMHAGFPPFQGANALEIYDRILEGKLKFPKTFNLFAKDLCRKLLQTDRTQRIGGMKNGAADVKAHKWFAQLDWDEVAERKLTPPLVPTLFHAGDTGNFDSYEEQDWDEMPDVSQKEQELFTNW
uniref:Uncharacterized protein n=1 Tax=Plectus sambesii TaxID=2011161 RepID=A0A914V1Z2_9BILA